MVYTSICKNCGKEYRAKTRRSMFCCEECRREADKERKRIQYGAVREKRVCPECGRTFETTRKTSNFCSRACSVKFLREKGTCYLCGGKCDFEDVVLRDGFLAAGSTFPAIVYIAASDRKTQSVRLAHYCCLKQKGGKHV